MPDSIYEPPKANLDRSRLGATTAITIDGALEPHHRMAIPAIIATLTFPLFILDGWVIPTSEMPEEVMFSQFAAIAMLVIAGALWFMVAKVKSAVDSRISSNWALIFESPDGTRLKVATVPWFWALQYGGLSLAFHGRRLLGWVLAIANQFTLGLVGLVLVFLINSMIRRTYAEVGYRELTQS